MMSLKKHEDLKAQGREVGVVVEVEPPKISYSNLLKSISYRCLLDDWMEIHCKVRRDNNTIKDRIKERKLRLDILELSNSNSYLKGVIRELEFRLGADRGSESEVLDFNSDDLDDAYRAIDSLLREFCDLVIIEDSGVAVNNSLRKVLIPSPKFNKYLKWKTRFAKG
jgi:hypothetical protein